MTEFSHPPAEPAVVTQARALLQRKRTRVIWLGLLSAALLTLSAVLNSVLGIAAPIHIGVLVVLVALWAWMGRSEHPFRWARAVVRDWDAHEEPETARGAAAVASRIAQLVPDDSVGAAAHQAVAAIESIDRDLAAMRALALGGTGPGGTEPSQAALVERRNRLNHGLTELLAAALAVNAGASQAEAGLDEAAARVAAWREVEESGRR